MKVRGSGWCCKQYPVLKLVYSEQIHGTGFLPTFIILQEKIGFCYHHGRISVCAYVPAPLVLYFETADEFSINFE
jgi:hypothetical protein